MTNRWYLLLDGHVVGPLTESEIDQKVTSPLDPVNQSETLIWGKGFPEWVQYSQWKTEKNITICTTLTTIFFKDVAPLIIYKLFTNMYI